MTFEEAMQLTSGVSAPAAFEQDECQSLYDALQGLPTCATVLEVGCEFGRSSSLLAQVAREKQFRLVFIDPFVDPASTPRWMATMHGIGVPFTLLHMTTEQAVRESRIPRVIHFALIDGDHTEAGVTADCDAILPWMTWDGVVAAHDYGRDSLPDVYKVLSVCMADWQLVSHKGTLAMWRKP